MNDYLALQEEWNEGKEKFVWNDFW
jgi:hypothetical protein